MPPNHPAAHNRRGKIALRGKEKKKGGGILLANTNGASIAFDTESKLDIFLSPHTTALYVFFYITLYFYPLLWGFPGPTLPPPPPLRGYDSSHFGWDQTHGKFIWHYLAISKATAGEKHPQSGSQGACGSKNDPEATPEYKKMEKNSEKTAFFTFWPLWAK